MTLSTRISSCILLIFIFIFFERCQAGGDSGEDSDPYKSSSKIKTLFGLGLGYQKVVWYKPVLVVKKPKFSLGLHGTGHGSGHGKPIIISGGGHHAGGGGNYDYEYSSQHQQGGNHHNTGLTSDQKEYLKQVLSHYPAKTPLHSITGHNSGHLTQHGSVGGNHNSGHGNSGGGGGGTYQDYQYDDDDNAYNYEPPDVEDDAVYTTTTNTDHNNHNNKDQQVIYDNSYIIDQNQGQNQHQNQHGHLNLNQQLVHNQNDNIHGIIAGKEYNSGHLGYENNDNLEAIYAPMEHRQIIRKVRVQQNNPRFLKRNYGRIQSQSRQYLKRRLIKEQQRRLSKNNNGNGNMGMASRKQKKISSTTGRIKFPVVGREEQGKILSDYHRIVGSTEDKKNDKFDDNNGDEDEDDNNQEYVQENQSYGRNQIWDATPWHGVHNNRYNIANNIANKSNNPDNVISISQSHPSSISDILNSGKKKV